VGDAYAIRRAHGAAWTTPASVGTPTGSIDTSPAPGLSSGSDGGTLGVFQFRDPGARQVTVATGWPAGAAGPDAATTALCAGGAECAGEPPQVAVDGAGNGYAVGVAGFVGDIVFARREAGTGVWAADEIVANGASPQLAVNAGGDVVIAYTRTDNSNPALPVRHVYAKRRLAGETGFGPEVQVSGPNTVDNVGHAIVIDDAGSATIAFSEDTLPPGGSPSPSAPVIMAATWARASATPDAAAPISVQSDGQARFVVAAADPQGRVTAAWQSFAGHFGVFAAELTASGWSPSQHVSPEGSDRNAVRPRIAVDAAGTATVVYEDNASPQGGDLDVKVSRRPTGESWSAPESLRFTESGAGAVAGSSQRVAAGLAGQADVIFVQQLDGTNRLFATRFDHGGYPRPKSAGPLRVSLVPAFGQCTAPNETHGPPLSFGSCAPPAQRSSHVTVGTPDANGRPARSIGSARLRVVPGDPGTPANEADVPMSVSITDVRRKDDLSDYAGELQAILIARITDRDPDPSGDEPSTIEDFGFGATVPCVATPDAGIGAACSTSTSLNALVPGAVTEGRRAIWQLRQVQVFDGGADGDVDTSPNTLFAVQGIFIP
ncbi:MAG: hypothetical protein ACRDLQ_10830, partial [Solirubrobacterales bacterium]